MNEVLKQIGSHTTVRKYKQEEVPKEKLKEILSMAQHTSTSQHIQAYSVIHVTDKEKKEKLATLTGNAHVGTSGAFLVFCVDLKRLEEACKRHNVRIQAGSTENFLLSVVDVTLFAQNVVLGCQSEGYGICYIGGIRNNIWEISRLLGLPDKVMPLVGLTIGVPDEKNEQKPRLPLEAILHENTYDGDFEDALTAYDNTMLDYYNSRGANQKQVNWTSNMSEIFHKVSRPYMAEFVREKGFLQD